jgi:hypothetical protein
MSELACRDACICHAFRQVDAEGDPGLCWCSHYRAEHPSGERPSRADKIAAAVVPEQLDEYL